MLLLKAQSKINDVEADKDRLIKFILFEWVSNLRLILLRPVPNSLLQEADHKHICRLQKQKLLVRNSASQLTCAA